MGKISDNKSRFLLLIEKDDKLQLEQIAKKECRSLNNLINIILKNYLESKKGT